MASTWGLGRLGAGVCHMGGCHRSKLEEAICDVTRGPGEETMGAPAEGCAEQSCQSCGAGEEPGRAHDPSGICLWPGEEILPPSIPCTPQPWWDPKAPTAPAEQTRVAGHLLPPSGGLQGRWLSESAWGPGCPGSSSQALRATGPWSSHFRLLIKETRLLPPVRKRGRPEKDLPGSGLSRGRRQSQDQRRVGTPGPPAAFPPSSSSSEVSAEQTPGLRGGAAPPGSAGKWLPQGKAASLPQSCLQGATLTSVSLPPILPQEGGHPMVWGSSPAPRWE